MIVHCTVWLLIKTSLYHLQSKVHSYSAQSLLFKQISSQNCWISTMRPEFSYFFATGQWTALALFLNLANLPCLGYLPIQETLVFCQFCLAIFRQRKTEPVWDKVHVHFEMSAVSILGASPRRWWQPSLETAARQKRTPHDLWKWRCLCLCPNFALFVHLHFCKLHPKTFFWRCVVCSLDPSHCELQWLTSRGAASGLSWSCATNEKISWMAVVEKEDFWRADDKLKSKTDGGHLRWSIELGGGCQDGCGKTDELVNDKLGKPLSE